MRNVLTGVRISDGDADSTKYFSAATNTVEPPPLPLLKTTVGLLFPLSFSFILIPLPLLSASIFPLIYQAHVCTDSSCCLLLISLHES